MAVDKLVQLKRKHTEIIIKYMNITIQGQFIRKIHIYEIDNNELEISSITILLLLKT